MADKDNVLKFEPPRVRVMKTDLHNRLNDVADEVAAQVGVSREALLEGCAEFLEANQKSPRKQ